MAVILTQLSDFFHFETFNFETNFTYLPIFILNRQQYLGNWMKKKQIK